MKSVAGVSQTPSPRSATRSLTLSSGPAAA
jgi:hypothetical protein